MSSANDTRRTVTQAPISLLETIARDADLRARLEADPAAVLAEAENGGGEMRWLGWL